MVNLISNAVKFTSNGEIEIKIIWQPDRVKSNIKKID